MGRTCSGALLKSTEMSVQNTTPLNATEELDIPPSTEELSKAIDTVACGKGPGNEGIPPETIKFT